MYEFVIGLHLLFVGFIVVGFLGFLLYPFFRFGWVRNANFRVMHLLGISFVALESLLGLPCPLTVLEWKLRSETTGQSFIGRLFYGLLYYHAPQVYFTIAYVSLSVLAFSAYVLLPVSGSFRDTFFFRALRRPWFLLIVVTAVFFWLREVYLINDWTPYQTTGVFQLTSP